IAQAKAVVCLIALYGDLELVAVHARNLLYAGRALPVAKQMAATPAPRAVTDGRQGRRDALVLVFSLRPRARRCQRRARGHGHWAVAAYAGCRAGPRCRGSSP